MAPGAWLWSSQLACRQESLGSGPGDASSGHHCPDLSRLSRVMLCHIHLVIIVFTSVCASTCLSWSEGRAGVLLCLFSSSSSHLSKKVSVYLQEVEQELRQGLEDQLDQLAIYFQVKICMDIMIISIMMINAIKISILIDQHAHTSIWMYGMHIRLEICEE